MKLFSLGDNYKDLERNLLLQKKRVETEKQMSHKLANHIKKLAMKLRKVQTLYMKKQLDNGVDM